MAARRSLTVCLAASGGGHLRQLLDMQPAWQVYDHYIVTERTALGRSLEVEHEIHYVAHFAYGQRRLERPLAMLKAGAQNLFTSLRSVLSKRPDVIITTGAGSVFFTVLFGKLLGAKIVVIESFARFDRASMFSKMAMPLANKRVVQSQKLSGIWQDALVFDPLKILDVPPVEKEDLIFGTVGVTLPFDRMIVMLNEAHERLGRKGRVVVQVGDGGHRPENMEAYDTLPLDEMKAFMSKADVVVCHGGTGSLITALRLGCHVIAVPRQSTRGEHYDNHQNEITTAFAARGLIRTANTKEELVAALQLVATTPRVAATTDTTQLNAFLTETLEGWGRPSPLSKTPDKV